MDLHDVLPAHRLKSELRRMARAKVVLSRLDPAVTELASKRIKGSEEASPAPIRPRLFSPKAEPHPSSEQSSAKAVLSSPDLSMRPAVVPRLRGLPLKVDVVDQSEEETAPEKAEREVTKVFVCSHPLCDFQTGSWSELKAHKLEQHARAWEDITPRDRDQKNVETTHKGQSAVPTVAAPTALHRLTRLPGISLGSTKREDGPAGDSKEADKDVKLSDSTPCVEQEMLQDKSLQDLACLDDKTTLQALSEEPAFDGAGDQCDAAADSDSDCSWLPDAATAQDSGSDNAAKEEVDRPSSDHVSSDDDDKESSTGYRCMLCVERFADAAELGRHERDSHFAWAFRGFSDRLLDQGLLKDAGEEHSHCHICGQEFDNLFDGVAHVMKEHTGSKEIESIRVRCNFEEGTGNQCDFEDVCPRRLIIHFKTSHAQVPRKPKKPRRGPASAPRLAVKCQHCEHSSRTLFDMRAHVMDAHGQVIPRETKKRVERRAVCSHCGQICRTRTRLEVHLAECHPEDTTVKVYSCKKCGFNGPRGLHTCLRTEVCDSCGSAFASLCSLKYHQQSYHVKLSCVKCGVEVEGSENLREHAFLFHREMCHDCGVPIAILAQFGKDTHTCPARLGPGPPGPDVEAQGRKVKEFSEILRVMPDKSILCLECGFSATTSKKITLHDAVVHRPQSCHICKLSFMGRAKFVEHLKTFHPNICTLCGGVLDNGNHSCAKVLSKDDSFLQHIPLRARPRFCHICNAVLSENRVSLEKHLELKHGIAAPKRPRGKIKGMKQRTPRIKRGEERRQECKL